MDFHKYTFLWDLFLLSRRYVGFKYDAINLSNIILGFLVIILSIQSKLGLKS